jgi:hypothetical protein
MRSRRTVLVSLAGLTVAFVLQTSSGTRRSEDVGVRAEIHGALSLSYVQVQMTISNDGDAAIWFPVCDNYQLCWDYFNIEQFDPKRNSWIRTVQHRRGDVSYGERVILRKGEATHAVLLFHPSYWKYDDDTPLAYPGRVRLVISVWGEDNTTPEPDKAVEIVTREFELPTPPRTWGATE